VSAAVDIVEIVNIATGIAWIKKIELSQSTEVKDAEEEMLQLAWRVGNTTSGSGGTTGIVANPILPGDAASGLTIEIFNTTKATIGTVTTLNWDWNVRMPFEKIFTPETELFLAPSQRACLELVAPPADILTMGGQIAIEVVG
jgi:hypothetical protein